METNINIEQQKALHTRIRQDAMKAMVHSLEINDGSRWPLRPTHRSMLLLWAYARGFKFRRIERTHRMDCGVEQNLPSAWQLQRIWKHYLPEVTEADINAWLQDPSGAIPAPPPRPKRVYTAAAE